jgi:CRISPR/Cas system-associated protein Csm6
VLKRQGILWTEETERQQIKRNQRNEEQHQVQGLVHEKSRKMTNEDNKTVQGAFYWERNKTHIDDLANSVPAFSS